MLKDVPVKPYRQYCTFCEKLIEPIHFTVKYKEKTICGECLSGFISLMQHLTKKEIIQKIAKEIDIARMKNSKLMSQINDQKEIISRLKDEISEIKRYEKETTKKLKGRIVRQKKGI